MRHRLLFLLALASAARAIDARTLTDALGNRAITRPIGDLMSRLVARSLPEPTASPGATFTFDPTTHAFVRSSEVEGQLHLEHARPIGRHRLNLSLTGSWLHADTLDNDDLDELRDIGRPIVDPRSRVPFTLPRFAVGLEVQQVAATATFGITSDLDVDLTLPFLVSRFELDAAARIVGSPSRQRAHVRETRSGPGDLSIRVKQRLLRGWLGEIALGLRVRLPSGDEDDFQGIGHWEVTPLLYVSSAAWRATPDLALRAHLNAGVAIDTEDRDGSESRFGLGIDVHVRSGATLSIAFLGREPFQGLAPPGFFDVRRVGGARAPLLGLDRGRVSTYELDLGARVVLWGDTLIGLVGVTLPLNRDGLRADVVPVMGIEAAF